MSDFIGLYYPHIEFPDDAWVKLAAFYWDRLGRIVPRSYNHQDSDTVQRLQGELGFVENFNPRDKDTSSVGILFIDMLREYGRKLIQNYSMLSSDSELSY